MADQIDNENMDMGMPDEARDDTNGNSSIGIFNMINYVKTSIFEFVKEERGEFEADVDDAATEETHYGTCWEIENDALPPIQAISFPQLSPEHPHPRPPQQTNESELIQRPYRRSRDQRKAKAEGSRDQRNGGGMGILKRLLSVPERGPRVLKKKEHKGMSSFGVAKSDDGPKVSVRYTNKTGIGNRYKWGASRRR
jgi:hypothetical protein